MIFGALNCHNLIYAQYGESEYIYQNVDDLENHDNWGFNSSITHNATLDCLELTYSSLIPSLQNYSEYTEHDTNNRFAVTDNTITVTSLSNKDVRHDVIYDYGAGYFTDFTHDVEVRVRDTSGTAGNDRMWVNVYANATGDIQALVTANNELFGVYFTEFDNSDPDDPEIRLVEYENGAVYMDRWDDGTASLNTWYYLRIVKVGDNFTCGIYSTEALRNAGSGYDGDLYTLSLILQNDYSTRYLYAVAGMNNGVASTRLISGDIHNLTFYSGGYLDSGYVFGNQVLGAGNVSLVDLLNATIPSGDSITVQYSSNNVSWSSPFTLVNGHNAIELRDLNYTNPYRLVNMTDGGADSTPRLLQFRSIYWSTTAPSGAGGVTTQIRYEYVGIPLAIILFMLGYFFSERR
jgi:hypothetical protein